MRIRFFIIVFLFTAIRKKSQNQSASHSLVLQSKYVADAIRLKRKNIEALSTEILR